MLRIFSIKSSKMKLEVVGEKKKKKEPDGF